jgi:MFS family permease
LIKIGKKESVDSALTLLLAGAQFGTVISYPLSGLLAEYGFAEGWPSIFYVFGIIGTVWSVAFLFMVAEDPDSSSSIAEDERKYITNSLWGAAGMSVSTNFIYK